jgi:hypothetical protein
MYPDRPAIRVAAQLAVPRPPEEQQQLGAPFTRPGDYPLSDILHRNAVEIDNLTTPVNFTTGLFLVSFVVSFVLVKFTTG